jgi:hypothetical protein
MSIDLIGFVRLTAILKADGPVTRVLPRRFPPILPVSDGFCLPATTAPVLVSTQRKSMRDEVGMHVGMVAIMRDVSGIFEEMRALKRKLIEAEKSRKLTSALPLLSIKVD